MDALDKKFILQFDDLPGVRVNALEAWCEHLKKAGRTFRDLVADLENARPTAKAEELEKKVAEYIKANAAAQKRDADLTREIANLKVRLKAALWVKTNWKMVGAGAGALLVVVAGGWTYERYWSRSEAVDAGLHAAVAEATWGEGWGEPVASRVGGEPYWIMFRGDIDGSSYSDSNGRPVEMRCLHLYAAPAKAYSSQYYKPSPRNFLGWMSWPELAMQCKPSPIQKADNIK
jgi:hypothetical protein